MAKRVRADVSQMGSYRTETKHRFFTLRLAFVAVAVAASACSPGGGGGSEPPEVGSDEILFKYHRRGGLSATEQWIYVWGDGSFAEYWTNSLSGFDEAALLATTPLNSGVLSAELLDQVHGVVRTAYEENIREGGFDGDCEFIDAPSSLYVLAGRRYVEPICSDSSWPFAAAREVVQAITAMDAGVPRRASAMSVLSVQGLIADGGALVAGEVVAVTVGTGRLLVDVSIAEAIVGWAEPEADVLFDVADTAATDEERAAVAALALGSPVWVVLDRSGTGERLAALDQSGHLIDWGPSTSQFSLGRSAFLAAATQEDELSRLPRCANSESDPREPSAGGPGDTLVASLQKIHVEAVYKKVRRANNARNRNKPGNEHPATFVGGEVSRAYVVAGGSGRYLDSFTGSEVGEGGIARTIPLYAESSVSVFSIGVSETLCSPDKSRKRRTFVAMAFGELITTLPVDLLTVGGRTQIDLATGEVSTES